MAKKEPDIDSKIKELFAVVHKQQIEVDQSEKDVKRGWKTNCSLNMTRFGQPINIQTANKETIVDVYAELLKDVKYKSEAAKILGIEHDTTIAAFSLSDWEADFKKRIAIIEIKTKKTKLTNMEARLDAIVSPEQRREMELESILNEMD